MTSSRLALIVENDAGTRRLLEVLLTRSGFSTDLVATGFDAMLLLDHVDYDAIFLNVVLPGASGAEVVERIARVRPHALNRVVMFSSASAAEDRVMRERWPALRLIRKPFELGDVLEAAVIVNTAPAPRTLSVSDRFCRGSVLAGAKAGVVAQLRGTTLVPIFTFGMTPQQIEPFGRMSIEDPYPLCATVRTGKPIFCASARLATLEYPMLAAVWEKNEARAFATLPVRCSAEVAGVAGWSYREARMFAESERQMLFDLAEEAEGILRPGLQLEALPTGA